jgi:hypothetical protein
MPAKAIMTPPCRKEKSSPTSRLSRYGGTLAAKATASTVIRPRLVSDIEELKESVSVAEIKKQGFSGSFPLSIEIRPFVDHAGERSLDVIVVFPKGTPAEEVASPKTSRILSWIQDTILPKAGSGLWPYVFVRVDGSDVCPA